MSTRADVLSMLARLRDRHEPLPSRAELIGLLDAVVPRLLPRTYAGGSRLVDLGPALRVMARRGKVRTAAELGRELDPRANPEKAANLGGNRMRQMERNGWVLPGELGGWIVTDEGRAEAARESA
ncbi:hypothetical protein AX289_30640 [Methylorubrum populi]|nr:hypothetical protein AX289_30640 [Methylorubrum populi]